MLKNIIRYFCVKFLPRGKLDITELWSESPYYTVWPEKETSQNYRECCRETEELSALKAISGCLIPIGTEVLMEISIYLGHLRSCHEPSKTSLKYF